MSGGTLAGTGAAGVGCAPFRVARLDLRVEPRPWAFAEANRSAIAAHYAGETASNPTYFNGTMLMTDRWARTGDALTARLCRSDFASFLYWRAEHRAGRLAGLAGTRNLFGAAAVVSSDGKLLMSRMADHTANAGLVYFPCGSLDDDDVGADGVVDIDGSMARELAEETGLDLDEAMAEPDYWVVDDAPRFAVIRAWSFAEDAAALMARVDAHLAAGGDGELAGIRFVGGLEEIERDRCPPYTLAYLRDRFGVRDG